MTKSQAGKGTAFWFDVDFPEAGLVSRRYGVEAGAGLLLALEDFLRGLPEAALVRRGFFDHFLLLFICERGDYFPMEGADGAVFRGEEKRVSRLSSKALLWCLPHKE